jgi:GT2 family glycosyltransferase
VPDPIVSIIVVTYNSAARLDGLAESIPSAARDIAYEVIVVDNASSDDTVERVRDRLPEATVVEREANRGYAAGLNAGIAVARGTEAIVVCNPDIVMGGGMIPQLLGALSRPNAGVSAPRTTDDTGHLRYSLRRDQSVRRVLGEAVLGGTRACHYPDWSQIVGDDQEYTYAHTVDWASGAVLMISRPCLDAVGPWDESFFMYSEEVDFQRRAREAGFDVWYVPNAVARHTGGELHESRDLWAVQMENKVRLFRRRHNVLHTTAYRASWMLYETIRLPVGNGIHVAGLRALFGSQDARRTLAESRSES